MTTKTTARECLSVNDLDQAEDLCRRAIEEDSCNAEASHLLGIVYARRGSLEAARDYFQKATDQNSENSLYPYNLALAHQRLGQNDQAIDAYRLAIARRDDFLEARSNLGIALVDARRTTDAVDCFLALIDRFPDSSDSHFNLANTLQEMGQIDAAVAHYRHAIQLAPDHSAARENLGRAFADTGYIAEARRVWEEWLELDPGNQIASHMLAATLGDNAPERCADDYIRQEFNDDFAKTFDRQMRRLGYQSPLLIEASLRAFTPTLTNLEILDAGCGTGICGSFLRGMANRLVGVDLSAAMLAEARQQDLYDETIECEISEFMNTNPGAFDAIISCDTLCYFGELNTILAAAARCLKDLGILIFTVEHDTTAAANQTYRLQPHGRYYHTESYVRTSLEAQGFAISSISSGTHRKESGRAVQGLLVIATVRR